MKVLVTGSSGLIGSAAVLYHGRGLDLRVDNYPSDDGVGSMAPILAMGFEAVTAKGFYFHLPSDPVVRSCGYVKNAVWQIEKNTQCRFLAGSRPNVLRRGRACEADRVSQCLLASPQREGRLGSPARMASAPRINR